MLECVTDILKNQIKRDSQKALEVQKVRDGDIVNPTEYE